MQIDYPLILQKNMLNVFKEVLKEIETNGLKEGHHLYITFETNNNKIKIPNWLVKKFPTKMTIVIQYEYTNLKVFENSFEISLSFDDIKANLSIPYNAILSFADPYANFSLKLNSIQVSKNKEKKTINKNNIIELNKFRKS